jgi:DNA repair protein RecN (Recombination protein N)
VDAGIGGRVADVVGSRLQELGKRFQVLCITHLPQIAARGDAQFLIEKSIRGRRTVTRVERLDQEGRIEEIARMIGGATITEQTRTSARELLDNGSERTRPTMTGGRILSDAPEGERRKAKAKARE